MPNIYQTAMFNAERHPAKTAVSDDSQRLTFAEFCARARAIASHLAALGVGPGDRVAVMWHNSVDYLALLHATAVGGFIVVPVNVRYSTEEFRFLVGDCDPAVILIEPEFAHHAEALRARGDGGDALWLERFPGDIDDAPLGYLVHRYGVVEDDDVALILYTSGTTSSPKGAMLTHGNLAWNAINYIVELGIGDDSRAVLATPLFHIGGFGVVNGPVLYAGGSLHVVSRFDAPTMVETLQTHAPTHLFLLSTMWVALTDLPGFDTMQVPSVSFVQTAAAPLGQWRQEAIQKVFGNADFSWGYGMTESCVTIIKNRYTSQIQEHPGSMGYIWRHFAHRLVDEEGALLADQKGPGVLEVKGPTVFKGYWRQPELTAQTLSDDGWLNTGDIVRLDDDGFAYFMGRSKDMIKTGGENVAALEVENCLAGHPDVSEAAVFGLAHEYWGEEVIAAVVPKSGHAPDPEDLRAYCRAHLSGFKVPKRIVIKDRLPQSSSGKVQKFVLKREFE